MGHNIVAVVIFYGLPVNSKPRSLVNKIKQISSI